jgi:lipopolysaccharide biosynthesis regulator YciM
MPTEATFLLAGLLILIAVGGWAFGQFLDRDRDGALPTRISADYIRGLNLVLSRKTDEALELFIQMAKVDDETLETHFALGHLFQRRGEVDRAIRVHQNLLARPNLNDMQHDQAVFALAEDYLGAGLFDRAERLFAEIADSETLAAGALERLVYIYEREREWQKAIDTERKLEMLAGKKSPEVAHYYCELAEETLKKGDREGARQHLKSTVRSATGALRGSLIRARIAHEEGDHAAAVELLRQVVDTERSFVSEILQDMHASYLALGRGEDFESYINGLIESDATAAGDVAYAAIVNDIQGSAALDRCIETFVADSEVLAELVDVESLQDLPEPDRQQALRRIASALRKLALNSGRYRCENCGYSTLRFLWHCPSCKLWETIKPLQRFQLEATIP